MWFDEHTSHGRNLPQQWVMQSSDSRFFGGGYDTVNWNLDFTTMKGVSWGDVEYYNANGIDGWIGKWLGKLHPSSTMTADGPIWLFDGRGQARGLGKYQDLRIHNEIHQSVFVYSSEADALKDVPCVTGLTGNPSNLDEVYVLQNDITALVTGHADD
jgi:hypothetical protein